MALAMQQLGYVPPEVKHPREEAKELANEIAWAWPKEGDQYPAEFVVGIVSRIQTMLSLLSDRVILLDLDPRTSEYPALRKDVTEADSYLGRAQQMASDIASEAHAQGEPIVTIPTLRADAPGLLAYAIKVWSDLDDGHTVQMGWMDEETALEIRNNLRLALHAVQELPGAKKHLHWGVKLGLGAVALGAIGAGAVWAWRRYRPAQLMDGELEIDNGIHYFAVDEGSGDVEVIDAEFEEIEGGMIGTAETKDGDSVQIVGNVEDEGELRRIARIVDGFTMGRALIR